MADAAMRNERVAFLDITPGEATPTYTLMGEGFTEVNDSLNPNVTEKTYIHESSATKRVASYAPEWAFNADVIKDSDIIEFLRDIGKAQKTGVDCETTMVIFDMWEAINGEVPAYRYAVTVALDNIGNGAGGEELTMSGNLLGIGDPVSGIFNTSDDTFVEGLIS
jgi:hypothetical protein